MLITNPSSTLIHLLRDKYGPRWGSWSAKFRNTTNNSTFWEDLNNIGGMFWKGIMFKIGEGSQVDFWKDKWCSTNPLCAMFPSIFELAADMDATITDYWQWN